MLDLKGESWFYSVWLRYLYGTVVPWFFED